MCVFIILSDIYVYRDSYVIGQKKIIEFYICFDPSKKSSFGIISVIQYTDFYQIFAISRDISSTTKNL